MIAGGKGYLNRFKNSLIAALQTLEIGFHLTTLSKNRHFYPLQILPCLQKVLGHLFSVNMYPLDFVDNPSLFMTLGTAIGEETANIRLIERLTERLMVCDSLCILY